MRDYEMVRRPPVRVPTAIAVAAVGVLLAFASSAAAAPNPAGGPLRFWSVSKIGQGAGRAKVASGAQDAGMLHRVFDLGPSAFNFGTDKSIFVFNRPLYASPIDGRASGEVFSSADGARYSVAAQAPVLNQHQANSPKGGVTHLDEYQAYVKRSGDASLRITITDAFMQAVDASLGQASECAQIIRCFPIRSIVRFHARAYAASAGGDFFNVGGTAFVTGHLGSWDPRAATSADSQAPLWTGDDFADTQTVCAQPTQAPNIFMACADSDAGIVHFLSSPRTLKVPLASVRTGELFGVHVSLEAETVDDRGSESAALAYIRDPQERGPALLRARGLTRRGKPRFTEPQVRPLSPARCPAGPRPKAGTVQLSAPAFTTSESDRDPLVLVTRKGGSRGVTSVLVKTSGGTARSGADFKPTKTLVRFDSGDTSPRLVEIPIREDQTVESPESFKVSLGNVRCSRLGKQRAASVTILDDDQPPSPPAPPAPTFTIGGTVDGLQGSGLVLTNLGTALPVSGNGTFTFPGTASAGQPYEVAVATQPTNPDQVCTVQDGKGTVSNANLTDIAVHCTTPAIPSGLDLSFGSGGKVSTTVGGGGEGQAVVIQPTGAIVTAGSRNPTGLASDFALTRHDAAGKLDPSFGNGGITVTDLGGADDEAFDAASLPDNGIVAVGRTDARGVQKTDFGVVRYLPDGTLNQNFGNGGIVTTPFFGKGAAANAVAVQPDGKIVVAGFAIAANGVDEDFAVARYNPDGSLDDNFGAHGVSTTDLGTENDDATGMAIQSDGKIVLAGNAAEDVGLVRLLPNGSLDPTFGNLGKSVTKIGFGADVNGVALDSGGGILIAGSTVGAKLNQDFLLAGFRADGTLNLGFGKFGFVTTDFGSGDDFAEDLTVDANGNIVLVGRASSNTITDLALARYDAGGNGGPLVTADFHGRGEFGQDVAIDAQGRIVAAGYTANGGDTEFALMRVFP